MRSAAEARLRAKREDRALSGGAAVRAWSVARWRVGGSGADQRAAVFWFLAFALVAGGYAVLAPVVDDWRSAMRAMTRGLPGGAGGRRRHGRSRPAWGGGRMRARIVGYDTPELFSPRCAAERRRRSGRSRRWRPGCGMRRATEVAFLGHDRYGRTLVDMRLSGQRVARGMVGERHGRRYFGQLRGGWCG